MKKILSFFFMMAFIGGSLLLPGCEVDYYEPSEGENNQGTGSSLFGDGVTVPAGFDWATIKPGKLSVKVDDRYKGQYYYQVEIYDENPIFSREAKLLAKGVAKQGQDWLATVDLPAHLEVIWVRQVSPIGQGVVKAVNITGGNLSVDFTPSTSGTSPQMRSASGSTEGVMISTRSGGDDPSTVFTTPEINGTTVLELSGEKNITLEVGKTYVIPAEKTFKGSLSFPWNNSTLYVEGTWENTSSSLSLENWTIIVQNGGKFISNVVGSLNVKGDSNNQLIVAEGGEFGKEGALMSLLQGDNKTKIVNSGTIRISGSQLRELYNYGTMTILGTLSSNSDAFKFINKGFFDVHSLNVKGTIDNDGQFIVTDNADFYSTLTFNIGTGALLEAKNLIMRNSTINIADNGMLKVTEQLRVENAGACVVKGPDSGNALATIGQFTVVSQWIDLKLQGEFWVDCSDYDVPYTGGTLGGMKTGSHVQFVKVGESTVTIPTSDYNKGGYSASPSTPITDMKFPIIYNGTTLTYLFEDNWPYLGDYDMNDLVLDVAPSLSTDASNKVTQLVLNVTLRAAGATKRMAVGLQLDGITPRMVSSFSRPATASIDGVFQGSGLETGQTYAVIPLFDDVHTALEHSSALMTNTIKGSPNNVEPRLVTLTINFTTSLNPADISVDKFNLFIVNEGYKGKRQEIHLAGFQPTDKADRRKFGMADDNSNVSPYFAYNNMIWGLAIPGPAKYPVEWRSIRLAYPGLESWATSGGTDSKDWYMNFNENSVYN